MIIINNIILYFNHITHSLHTYFILQVTGVGYNADGHVTCDGEIVHENSHPTITKLIQVSPS